MDYMPSNIPVHQMQHREAVRNNYMPSPSKMQLVEMKEKPIKKSRRHHLLKNAPIFSSKVHYSARDDPFAGAARNQDIRASNDLEISADF